MDALMVNLLTTLVCLLPLISLAPLVWLGYRRRQSILEELSIEPLLVQHGFKKVPFYRTFTEGGLYTLSKKSYSIDCATRDLPFEGSVNPAPNLLTFLVFRVQMPLRGRFLIRTPDLEEAENSLLDEYDWSPQPSDVLAALGLRVIALAENMPDLERRLRQPAFQRAMEDLARSHQPFYAHAASNYYLELGFGLLHRSSLERSKRWIEIVAQFVRDFYEPNLQRDSKSQATLRWVWIVILLGVMTLLSLLIVVLFGRFS